MLELSGGDGSAAVRPFAASQFLFVVRDPLPLNRGFIETIVVQNAGADLVQLCRIVRKFAFLAILVDRMEQPLQIGIMLHGMRPLGTFYRRTLLKKMSVSRLLVRFLALFYFGSPLRKRAVALDFARSFFP